MSLDYEQQYYSDEIKFIVGCDEAGRGCLLGPVVAGAVILPKDFKCDLINDSKQLSEKQREEAYQIIKEHALAWAVAEVSPQEIDQINILNASRKAMVEAMKKLNHKYDMILTDAVKIQTNLPFEAIIHGDAKAMCIAAASIMAKVTRDHICYELDKKYPQYQIAKHKGYGTKLHLELLEKYGPIKSIYRFTYAPVKKFTIEKVKLF
ncbi:MAG: ribonuclease HII [Bacilli bacterium]|nr:ribonuclease HII [Bacilli bacterium]